MNQLNESNIIENYIFNNIDEEKLFLNSDENNKKDYEISKIILKLLKGEKDIEFSNLSDFLDGKSKPVILLRWKAIEEIYNNNFIFAESILLDALEIAKKNRVDKWIVRDIQVDLFNLENQKERKNILFNQNKYQKKLSSMKKWNYRPYIDWDLENSLFDSMIENFNYQTDSPTTIRFGGTFRNSTQKFLSAFESVILNGSYTFIHVLRERLAYIFYNYGTLLNESTLLFHSLKLFMIEGNIKNIEKILNSNWDDLYEVLIDDPGALLNFSFLKNDQAQSKVLKCVVIKKFGAYFPEFEVESINNFLKDCLTQDFSMNSGLDVQRNAIKAYKDIINRTKNKEEIINILLSLFIQNNDFVSDEIIKVLRNLDWELISSESLNNVANTIYFNIEKTNYDSDVYYILSKIKKYLPSVLIDVEKDMLNKWIENKKLSINYYFSQYSLENNIKSEMIEDIIYRIDGNNKSMKKGSPISVGGYQLLGVLNNHLLHCQDFERYELINLYESILLNPYQSTSEKYDCINNMIILIKNNQHFKKYIILNMKDFFNAEDNYKKILDSRGDDFIIRGNIKLLEMKLLELCVDMKVFQKSNTVKEMIAKCIEYGSDSSVEVREGTLSLIESISEGYDEIYINEILQFLYSKTFEKWFKIKGKSIYLLNTIGNQYSSWESIVINRTASLADDSSVYVRSSIIQAYLKMDKPKLTDTEITVIISVLKRDKHYKLRAEASKIDKSY